MLDILFMLTIAFVATIAAGLALCVLCDRLAYSSEVSFVLFGAVLFGLVFLSLVLGS